MSVSVVVAIFTVAVVLNLFSVPFATAQEEKPKQERAQKKQPQKTLEMETMTVTAQKREENVQDVPTSISVFSDIQIEDSGMKIPSI